MKFTIVDFIIEVRSGLKTVILSGASKGKLFFEKTYFIIVFRNVPYLGLITIIMNDYPQVKFLILAVLGIFVLINRDQ